MAFVIANIPDPQLIHQSGALPLPVEEFSRFDERIIHVVEAYLPHAAKAVCVQSQCLTCTHLIYRAAGSICRKANVLGQWPDDPNAGDAGHCQAFRPYVETEA